MPPSPLLVYLFISYLTFRFLCFAWHEMQMTHVHLATLSFMPKSDRVSVAALERRHRSPLKLKELGGNEQRRRRRRRIFGENQLQLCTSTAVAACSTEEVGERVLPAALHMYAGRVDICVSHFGQLCCSLILPYPPTTRHLIPIRNARKNATKL
jgi:hypothetical protein